MIEGPNEYPDRLEIPENIKEKVEGSWTAALEKQGEDIVKMRLADRKIIRGKDGGWISAPIVRITDFEYSYPVPDVFLYNWLEKKAKRQVWRSTTNSALLWVGTVAAVIAALGVILEIAAEIW